MRAITLWQPWASLIAIGAKPFETRSWAPPASLIGQRIAIHAAKREADLMWMNREIGAWFDTQRDKGTLPRPLPYGAIVCTAILAAAYRCGEMDSAGRVCVTQAVSRGDDPVLIQSDPFGDYRPGRWAWLLADVQPLATPAPARGKQGWWTWSPPDAVTLSAPTGRPQTAPGGYPANP